MKKKYDIIKELADYNGNKNRASKKLGISRRQIDRLIITYKEKGKSGFVHGNRSRKPANTLDKSISEDIILLYKHKYQDGTVIINVVVTPKLIPLIIRSYTNSYFSITPISISQHNFNNFINNNIFR